MSVLAAALESTLAVTSTLEALGVRYAVGGSVASSLLGIPRMTNDADVVAAMREEHVESFAKSLEADFYVDRDMIRDAIDRAYLEETAELLGVSPLLRRLLSEPLG